jgi:hypothetical protein
MVPIQTIIPMMIEVANRDTSADIFIMKSFDELGAVDGEFFEV